MDFKRKKTTQIVNIALSILLCGVSIAVLVAIPQVPDPFVPPSNLAFTFVLASGLFIMFVSIFRLSNIYRRENMLLRRLKSEKKKKRSE